ncbi:hypothetical protein F4677DRAFT_440582 [Hypoxylon crocopeplum]|nr:hypothetical protein F4677DRAFT_440582 [Hypoxylon crocopeplum]
MENTNGQGQRGRGSRGRGRYNRRGRGGRGPRASKGDGTYSKKDRENSENNDTVTNVEDSNSSATSAEHEELAVMRANLHELERDYLAMKQENDQLKSLAQGYTTDLTQLEQIKEQLVQREQEVADRERLMVACRHGRAAVERQFLLASMNPEVLQYADNVRSLSYEILQRNVQRMNELRDQLAAVKQENQELHTRLQYESSLGSSASQQSICDRP